MGIPTFNGQPQTTFSCVADENCNYDVHIIGNADNGHTLGSSSTRNTNIDVQLSVNSQGSNSPLVLVFVSREPVNWILDIPSGVVIEKVLVVRNRSLHTP